MISSVVALTSCGSDKCECTIAGSTSTYEEDDFESGTLQENCTIADEIAKNGSSSDGCSMK